MKIDNIINSAIKIIIQNQPSGKKIYTFDVQELFFENEQYVNDLLITYPSEEDIIDKLVNFAASKLY